MRRATILAGALALLISSAAAAQDDWPTVYVHGSFENQLTGIGLRLYNGEDRLTVYDYLRLRIDVDADLPGDLQLRSDVVARLFVGETELYVVNLIPRRTFDQLLARDPRWAIAIEDKYELDNELYLDNAYLKIPIQQVLVTVGKQPLEQGAGYAWNPTDVFTDKDMFDPTYEKEGVIALRLMVPIGDVASIDAVGAPKGMFEDWIAGGRASLRLGPVSLSAASYYTHAKQTHLEESMDNMEVAMLAGADPNDAIIRVEARRTMVGGDIVADIVGVRLWAEGAYNFVDDVYGAPADWWELVGGAEYYFPFETHLMVEYYHYDRGPEQRDGTYDYNSWMSLISAELKMLGKDFLFESIDHPIADYWLVGVSSFQSITDRSAVIMADVRWEFVQDAELWLLIAAGIGDPEDLLSSAYGQGWLRLKVFF
jgi:hypothetical protein